MADIRMQQVRKSFGKAETIHGVDLHIEAGKLAVFVGPSGCGKSTLLRLIAGLEDITAGELFIGDKCVNGVQPDQRGVSMVFQSYALYPHMDVFDNMAFGLKLAHRGKAEVKKLVTETAGILQMDHLLERKPRELSGGQRQRVAIGRAIVREPQVFLFDEPLSNLDAALRVQMRIEIQRLHQRLRTTMVYVTHDQVEAMTLADSIVVLNEGRVAQVGSPITLYRNPDNLFVAGFIGSPQMNFIKGELAHIEAGQATVTLHGGLQVPVAVEASHALVGAEVTLGIRPEHFGPAETELPAMEGKALVIEQLGDQSLIYVESEITTEPVVLRTEQTTAVQVGDPVRATLAPEACHLFDDEGQAFPRLIDPQASDEFRVQHLQHPSPQIE